MTQCNTKTERNNVTDALSTAAKAQAGNPITGEWKYSNSIWYASELTLKDNGTFKFHDKGCYGQMYSEGKYSFMNGNIQLTSFETFKQKEHLETKKLTEVTSQKNPRHKLRNGEDKYTFLGFKDVQLPVLPGPNDTVRIYLDRIQLRLSNDSLYCVGPEKLPEAAKFYRTKNNR